MHDNKREKWSFGNSSPVFSRLSSVSLSSGSLPEVPSIAISFTSIFLCFGVRRVLAGKISAPSAGQLRTARDSFPDFGPAFFCPHNDTPNRSAPFMISLLHDTGLILQNLRGKPLSFSSYCCVEWCADAPRAGASIESFYCLRFSMLFGFIFGTFHGIKHRENELCRFCYA